VPDIARAILVAAAVATMSVTASADSAKSVKTTATLPAYLVGRGIPAPLAELEAKGAISDAEAWIAAALTSPQKDAATASQLADEQQRLRRLRHDYSLDADAMLAKIRKDLPDATAQDLARWTRERTVQWIPIDGNTRYFRREPANFWRFADDARERRRIHDGATTATAGDPAARGGRRFNLNTHVAEALRAGDTAPRSDSTSATTVLPVTLKVRHRISVKPGTVPDGKTIRCWMPLPRAYRHQSAAHDLNTTPAAHTVSPDTAPMRTVYMEQAAPGAGKPAEFIAEYTYDSAAYLSGVDPDKARAPSAQTPELASSLAAQSPHVVLTPEVRALAREIVGDEKNPVRAARMIWLWIDKNIRYCSEMEYAVLPAIVDKIMAERRGDCGVQALLFIALCRASGVPARWQSGWVTRPGAWNMHDWAEFYAEPWGWVPADPSVGRRESPDPKVEHFFFGNLDAYRMIANLDHTTQFDPPKKHLRSDPVDNQRGEVEWEGGNLYFTDWDYEVTVEPVGPR
jgi:hypothetical protein